MHRPSNPLVTIGLPFYNNKQTILDAIRSIFIQTYANWELILLNDGSTDGSLELVKEIKDPRVVLVDGGRNEGLIARLNQIARLAKGKYIARMDADDLMQPSRIEKQVALLESDTEIDLVDTGTYSISQDGIPSGKRGLSDINRDPRHIIKHAMLLHASVVGKKSWFLANPYDKNYLRAEDYELWCRTYKQSKFARIKEPLYIVREGRVNVRNYKKSASTVRKIMKVYGTGLLSPTELRLELFKSNLKTIAYDIFSLVNKHDYLSKFRNEALTEEERESVVQIINNIQRVII